MMNLKSFLDIKLLGIVGAILVLLSEILPWSSSYSLLEIYVITINVQIENAFLFLFPIVSGILSLIANIIQFTKLKEKVEFYILDIMSLGLLFLFFFEIIPDELIYYLDYIGIYFCISGLLFILINLILRLTSNKKKDVK
ncbi:MAG: hypothetical protein GF317_02575 [Candidatus Lokiarchaeota archaeon]|nr:hypothetical protein [Candidatus Lokiarchaeota archaeon]MBD3198791.1 hypothetical protein [Candidatus Lokiarchaeota archaeon]